MAQEASDHTCLQHVLSLLYRTVDGDQKQRLIERCIEKCGELSLSYLASLGIQAASQHAADSGCGPEQVLDLLTKSDVLNCQHSIAELQAVSYMCKATAWGQYGRPGLACTLSQLLLQTNSADPSRAGNHYTGEPTAIALCTTALKLEASGYPSQADLVVECAQRLFPASRSQHSRNVSIGKQRLMLWRAIAKMDWIGALSAVNLLEAAQAPDALLLKAELYFKEGKAVEARQLVQKLLASKDTAVEVEVRTLLLLADIHCWSGDPAGLLEKVTYSLFSNADGKNAGAVQQLVKSAEKAKRGKLQLLYTQARLQIAHCQVSIGGLISVLIL